MGVAVKASLALHLLPILLLLLLASIDAATFTITNNCSFTVWPAATPVGGGRQLNHGQAWSLQVPAGTSSGRLWGRTGCSFRGGSGSCQTGDCGGVLSCTLSPQPPVTLAEFTLSSGTTDFFDISVVDGFNLPMDFMGGPGCSKGPRCLGNSTSQCSDAYINPTDDNKTFACPAGTDYQLVFCPSVDLRPPVTVSPQPASSPATVIQIVPPSPTPVLSPSGATPARSSSRIKLLVILATVGGLTFLAILFTAIFFMCKRRAQHQDMEEVEEFGDLGTWLLNG